MSRNHLVGLGLMSKPGRRTLLPDWLPDAMITLQTGGQGRVEPPTFRFQVRLSLPLTAG